MDPISRTAGAGTSNTQQPAADGRKSGPSKFDQLRADLNQKLNPAGQSAQGPVSLSGAQKQSLENDLHQKLQLGQSPRAGLTSDLKRLQAGIADLQQRVAAVPDSTSSSALRNRLQSIESEFNASAKLLDDPAALNDPKSLLQMQMQVYKLSENVEILSRTVGDAASGVKSILQTQV
jgi:type III secretion system YscI/HrpB-like protein